MVHSLLIKNVLFRLGIMSFMRRFSSGRTAAVLRYHAVVDAKNNFYVSPSICIGPKEFESQVRFLAKNYKVISLDLLRDCIREQRRFPKNAVVLTFDDGYRDNFQAYKIMKKYSISGAFYVTAACVDGREALWLFEVYYLLKRTRVGSLLLSVKGAEIHIGLQSEAMKTSGSRKVVEIIKSNNLEVREDLRGQLRRQIRDVSDFEERASQIMLTWQQIKEMGQGGMVIGGHTMTHLNLPNADVQDAEREINECKRSIEHRTGNGVEHFAYPNGGNYEYYNGRIIDLVLNAGYSTAVTSTNGVVDLESNPFELSRIRITRNLSEIVYQMNCEPLVGKRNRGRRGGHRSRRT